MKTYRWTIFVLHVRYLTISKVFSLGRCSISFHLTNFWNFDPLAIYSSNIVNLILFPQSWIPYYTWRNCLCKKNIFANWAFCLQIWNICTLNWMRHQKGTFFVYWTYIYLFFFIILFSKSKTKKFLRRIKHLK